MEHTRTTTTPGRIRGRSRRSTSLVLTAVFLLSVGLALPAEADPPVTDSFTNTFTDVNPCSGEDHQVSIHHELRIHVHPNNTVVRDSRTGTTDSGFEMVNGTAYSVENGNIFTFGLTDVWHNPATGERFTAIGTLVVDLSTFTMRVERFSLSCLG